MLPIRRPSGDTSGQRPSPPAQTEAAQGAEAEAGAPQAQAVGAPAGGAPAAGAPQAAPQEDPAPAGARAARCIRISVPPRVLHALRTGQARLSLHRVSAGREAAEPMPPTTQTRVAAVPSPPPEVAQQVASDAPDAPDAPHARQALLAQLRLAETDLLADVSDERLQRAARELAWVREVASSQRPLFSATLGRIEDTTTEGDTCILSLAPPNPPIHLRTIESDGVLYWPPERPSYGCRVAIPFGRLALWMLSVGASPERMGHGRFYASTINFGHAVALYREGSECVHVFGLLPPPPRHPQRTPIDRPSAKAAFANLARRVGLREPRVPPIRTWNLPASNEAELCRFAQRLQETKDYGAGKTSRKKLVARVLNVLAAMDSEPALRRRCLAEVTVALTSCGDHVASGVGQLELAIELFRAGQLGAEHASEEALRRLARGLLRLDILREVAVDIATRQAADARRLPADRRPQVDPLEIEMALQAGLAKQLELPCVGAALRFEDCARLGPRQFAEAEAKARARSENLEPFLATFEPWQRFCRGREANQSTWDQLPWGSPPLSEEPARCIITLEVTDEPVYIEGQPDQMYDRAALAQAYVESNLNPCTRAPYHWSQVRRMGGAPPPAPQAATEQQGPHEQAADPAGDQPDIDPQAGAEHLLQRLAALRQRANHLLRPVAPAIAAAATVGLGWYALSVWGQPNPTTSWFCDDEGNCHRSTRW